MKFGGTWWKEFRETLRGGYEPNRIHVLADLYWRTLILSGFVVLVLVFLYSSWHLANILEDLGAGAGASSLPPSALSRGELNAVVSAFDARKSQFETLKANPPAAIADPSR